MKPLAFRRSTLVLSIALGSLFFTPARASAGTAELKALATQLNGGTLPSTDLNALKLFIKSKNSTEVANAVVALIQAKPTAAAAYAGEALKRSDDSDFGTVLGQALNANAGSLPSIFNAFPADPVKTAATKAKFIGTSAKNAATSTDAFAEWIDEFARELTTTNQEAYDAAKSATASKTAVGLIVGSRTLDPALNTDALRLDLARKAVLPKNTTTGGQGLTASAQEIARYVGDAVTDPAAFAHDLTNTSVTIGTKTTQPLLVQLPAIATGTATSNPSVASNIVDALFDGVNPPANLVVSTASATPLFLAAVKNAAKLATSVSLVADAEQVQAVGVALGARIGVTTTDTGKVKIVGIKQTSVSAIAKSLVLGLTTRPGRNLVTNNGDNRTNRIDEIGEVGAYLVNAIKNLPVFQGKDTAGNPLTGTKLTAAGKQATALVTGLLKSIISSAAKLHRDVAGFELGTQKGTLVKTPSFQATVADDVSGSVALTLFSLQGSIDATIFNAIKAALTTDAKIGTKIAGSSKATFRVDLNDPMAHTIGDIVKNALALGINNSGNASLIFEDGTIAANAVDVVNSAETDVRNR